MSMANFRMVYGARGANDLYAEAPQPRSSRLSPNARRGLIIFLVGGAILAAVAVFDYWWIGMGPTAQMSPVAIGGPYTLTDQNGKVRHPEDFKGRLTLVYFGYTFCPDACPTALSAMSAALDELGPKGEGVQPLFITVDPARDTVEAMKIYAENFHSRLIALTGTPQETAVAARAYKVYYQKVQPKEGGDYLMDHSSYIYLMDREGKYLAHFGTDATAGSLATALRKYL